MGRPARRALKDRLAMRVRKVRPDPPGQMVKSGHQGRKEAPVIPAAQRVRKVRRVQMEPTERPVPKALKVRPAR